LKLRIRRAQVEAMVQEFAHLASLRAGWNQPLRDLGDMSF